MTQTANKIAWTCYNCGHGNDYRETACSGCGHPRYSTGPGQTAVRPPVYQIPGFFGMTAWTLAAVSGAAFLFLPGLRGYFGVPWLLAALQTVVAVPACFSGIIEFVWNFRFKHIDVTMPDAVPAREQFEVHVNLLPYNSVENITVDVDLVDRFFVQDPQGGFAAQSQLRDAYQVATKERIPGGQLGSYACRFKAPFPSFGHENLSAEVVASILPLFAWVIPGLSRLARNLKEHGGYFVRVRVRIGWLWRTYERRVTTYDPGHGVILGA